MRPGVAPLALAEGAVGDDCRAGQRGAEGRAAPFAWPAGLCFRPAAAAPSVGGEVLFLERGYLRPQGWRRD